MEVLDKLGGRDDAMKQKETILTAKLDTVSNTGGCNFCTRHLGTVWEVGSRDENRHLAVKLCPECLKELKEATKTTEADIKLMHYEWFKKILIQNGAPKDIEHKAVVHSCGFGHSEIAFLAGWKATQ